MPDTEHPRAESLGMVTVRLTDDQLQRLSDIAYGMMLAQESKKEQDKQTA